MLALPDFNVVAVDIPAGSLKRLGTVFRLELVTSNDLIVPVQHVCPVFRRHDTAPLEMFHPTPQRLRWASVKRHVKIKFGRMP